MSADGKPACGRTIILTGSARKTIRKEVLVNYNKTRINIGHQHDRWMELFRVQTHAEFSVNINAITHVVRKCIINYDERQAAHTQTKTKRKYESRQTTFNTHVLKVYFQTQKKNFQRKKYQTYRHYRFKCFNFNTGIYKCQLSIKGY